MAESVEEGAVVVAAAAAGVAVGGMALKDEAEADGNMIAERLGHAVSVNRLKGARKVRR